MLAVAATGLPSTSLAFWVLSRGDRGNLNLRAALLHVVGDLLGSVAAIAAALVILSTGWTPIDPILSVLVALLILRSAWGVVRDSGHILLEASPTEFDPAAIAADLAAAVPDVTDIRHLHAWSITEARPMVTLEAVVAPGGDAEAARRRIKARLAERFGFDHATVETCGEPGRRRRLPAAGAARLSRRPARTKSQTQNMPIKIPATLPAHDVLRREGVMVMSEETALRQDIRPLQIGARQPDAEEGADRDPVRPASSARRRCRSS